MPKERKFSLPKQSQELKKLKLICKLLMALLIWVGVDSNILGKILGKDSSTVRHMLPFKELRKRGE